MIVQNNFYQNWTSDIYTSERAARTSPKSFYKSDDVRTFLNKSLENPENEKIKEELCISKLELVNDIVVGDFISGEESTTWPESTTGIAVITVGAFSLVALLFCLTCCICVCCLREEKEKE